MPKRKRPVSKAMPDVPFNPIPLRERHDGWTADRQIAFIDALAASGCVADAARAVGMSARSAYRLRAHPQAGSFRLAWDNALEFAILQLQDAVFSRAIKGVPIPHYYQGKKVGEHRRYDERLAQFLLRTRQPAFFGRAAEAVTVPGQSHHYAIALARAILSMELDGTQGGPLPGMNRGPSPEPHPDAAFDLAAEMEDGDEDDADPFDTPPDSPFPGA